MTLGYSLSSEAVVMRQLRRWNRLWQRSLTRTNKWASMGPSRSCLNGTTSALQPMGPEFHVCTINKSAHTKKSANLFNDPRILVFTYMNNSMDFYRQLLVSCRLYTTIIRQKKRFQINLKNGKYTPPPLTTSTLLHEKIPQNTHCTVSAIFSTEPLYPSPVTLTICWYNF